MAQLQCCVKLSLSTNMIVNIQVFVFKYKLSSRFFIDDFIFNNMIFNIQIIVFVNQLQDSSSMTNVIVKVHIIDKTKKIRSFFRTCKA